METFETINPNCDHLRTLSGMNYCKAMKVYDNLSKRIKTDFEKLNQPRKDGFPIVKEIVSKNIIISCAKDSVFNRPLSELEKEY